MGDPPSYWSGFGSSGSPGGEGKEQPLCYLVATGSVGILIARVAKIFLTERSTEDFTKTAL